MRIRPLIFILCLIGSAALAQESAPEPAEEPAMTMDRLAEILNVLDPETRSDGRQFYLTIDDVPLLVITDPVADRMRAIIPIRSSEGMSAEELLRVMQANFDTALDARYAVARGQLWATFIHPLSPLEKNQLLSALGQTVNLARTYGSLYTGGGLSFGGGDSSDIQRQLIEELLKKGEEI